MSRIYIEPEINSSLAPLISVSTDSGEGVLLKLNPGQVPGVVGRVMFDEK